MSSPPLVSRWATLIPACLLVMVALRQAYLVHDAQLTPWLGGGFGMFATVDRIDHRVIRAYVSAGEDERELDLAFLDGNPRLEAKARMMGLEERRAGFARLKLVRDLEMRARAMPTTARLERLGHSLLAHASESQSEPIESIRVEVWRIHFDAASMSVTASPLNTHVVRTP